MHFCVQAGTCFGSALTLNVYLISFVSEDSDALGILRESKDFFSEIEKVVVNKKEHLLEDSKLVK